MSNSLQLHGLHRARLSCPPLSPGVCSNSCPLNWRCHLVISSSVMPFSSCPQSFSASGSFLVSWLFTSSGGQSIGVSASTLVLLMNTQHWFPLGLTGLISLQYKGFLRGLSCTTVCSWDHLTERGEGRCWPKWLWDSWVSKTKSKGTVHRPEL